MPCSFFLTLALSYTRCPAALDLPLMSCSFFLTIAILHIGSTAYSIPLVHNTLPCSFGLTFEVLQLLLGTPYPILFTLQLWTYLRDLAALDLPSRSCSFFLTLAASGLKVGPSCQHCFAKLQAALNLSLVFTFPAEPGQKYNGA